MLAGAAVRYRLKSAAAGKRAPPCPHGLVLEAREGIPALHRNSRHALGQGPAVHQCRGRAGANAHGALVLSTMPTFGAKWLFPRLPAFRAQYPQIELRFLPYE